MLYALKYKSYFRVRTGIGHFNMRLEVVNQNQNLCDSPSFIELTPASSASAAMSSMSYLTTLEFGK